MSEYSDTYPSQITTSFSKTKRFTVAPRPPRTGAPGRTRTATLGSDGPSGANGGTVAESATFWSSRSPSARLTETASVVTTAEMLVPDKVMVPSTSGSSKEGSASGRGTHLSRPTTLTYHAGPDASGQILFKHRKGCTNGQNHWIAQGDGGPCSRRSSRARGRTACPPP